MISGFSDSVILLSAFRTFSEWAYATLSTRECFGVTMTQKQERAGEVSGYVSYLLRLWREKGGQTTWWRASLQDPHSGQRVGFAHLDELVAFLREQTGLVPPAEGLVKGEHAPRTGSTSDEGGSE